MIKTTTDILTYSINWDTIAAGGDGAAIAIDQNGDGTPESNIRSDWELGPQEFTTLTGISNNPKKLIICHIPRGNPGNAQTINIGMSAVKTHLAHGDYLGQCINNAASTTPKTKSKKK